MSQEQKLILVVDDDEVLATSLGNILAKENFGVHVARDGEEGLTIAFRTHPDLILLDILLPKMDGMAVLKKLREDEWGKNVPVIVLTNLSEPKHLVVSPDDKSDYLIKADFGLHDIAQKIKERLGG